MNALTKYTSAMRMPRGVALYKNGQVIEEPIFNDPHLLDPVTPNQFWISWDHDTIQFGKGNSKRKNEIIHYPDIDFISPSFLRISTGPGSEGSWVFTETYENVYIFANTPQVDDDEPATYGGVLVSPRTGFVTFEVRACSDVRVALTMDPNEIAGDFVYFIDIGVDNNTMTEITRGASLPLVEQETRVLKCDSTVAFWLTWENSTLSLGLGITAGYDTAISYTSGSEGEFDFYKAVGFYFNQDDPVLFSVLDNSADQMYIKTHNNYEEMNTWMTAKNEFFKSFTLKACSDAIITMAEAVGESAVYDVIFGYNGNPDALGINVTGIPPIVIDPVPGGLLDCDVAREFWISWIDGITTIGKGHIYNEYTITSLDDSSAKFNALGISTWNQQYGSWTFEMDNGDEIITSTSPTLMRLSGDKTWFYVRIRGTRADVTLSEEYGADVNSYTFTWGDGANDTFTLTRNSDGIDIYTAPLNSPLDSVYLQDYWISWGDGMLRAGYGRMVGINPIVSDYPLGQPYNASSVRFENDAEFAFLSEIGSESLFNATHEASLDDMFWYKLRRRTYLLFGVTSCGGAYITLSPVVNEVILLKTYNIHLGVENNNGIQISSGVLLAESNTTNVLDCNQEKLFWVAWNNRKLQIGEGSDFGYGILLELNNITSPIPVNAASFFAPSGSTTTWRVSNNQFPLGEHPQQDNNMETTASVTGFTTTTPQGLPDTTKSSTLKTTTIPGGSNPSSVTPTTKTTTLATTTHENSTGGEEETDESGDSGLSSGAIVGIVLGCIAVLLVIAGAGFVALKGVPPTVKNLYTNTKESILAQPQYSHSVMNATYSGYE